MSTEQPDGPSPPAVANWIAHTLAEADSGGLGDTLGAAELAVLRMVAEGSVDVEAMCAASRAARAARPLMARRQAPDPEAVRSVLEPIRRSVKRRAAIDAQIRAQVARAAGHEPRRTNRQIERLRGSPKALFGQYSTADMGRASPSRTGPRAAPKPSPHRREIPAAG